MVGVVRIVTESIVELKSVTLSPVTEGLGGVEDPAIFAADVEFVSLGGGCHKAKH